MHTVYFKYLQMQDNHDKAKDEGQILHYNEMPAFISCT